MYHGRKLIWLIFFFYNKFPISKKINFSFLLPTSPWYREEKKNNNKKKSFFFQQTQTQWTIIIIKIFFFTTFNYFSLPLSHSLSLSFFLSSSHLMPWDCRQLLLPLLLWRKTFGSVLIIWGTEWENSKIQRGEKKGVEKFFYEWEISGA